MRIITTAFLLFLLAGLLDGYLHTPGGVAAQLGYTCGYTAGIYEVVNPSHKEGPACADFRRIYQIDKDGTK